MIPAELNEMGVKWISVNTSVNPSYARPTRSPNRKLHSHATFREFILGPLNLFQFHVLHALPNWAQSLLKNLVLLFKSALAAGRFI